MKHHPLIATTALLAVLTLAACGRQDDTQTTGQRVDEIKTEAGQGLDAAKAATAEAAQDVKEGAGAAMDKAQAVLSDVSITASVNAGTTGFCEPTTPSAGAAAGCRACSSSSR